MRDVRGTVFVYNGKEYFTNTVMGIPNAKDMVTCLFPLDSNKNVRQCIGIVSDVLVDYVNRCIVVYLTEVALKEKALKEKKNETK